jgi:hypothetical protein
MIEYTLYLGWPNCVRLRTGLLEVVVTTDVGPRILHCSRPGQPNVLKVFDGDAGQMGGKTWRPYGGHRLWHAPEVHPRTYAPDNEPVSAEIVGDTLRIRQPVEASTGIEKRLTLTPAPDGSLTLIHLLRNHNAWPVELAPWSLTMMAQSGTAIIPLPEYAPHSNDTLLPVGTFTAWAYTRLGDPRWWWGSRSVQLRQDPAGTSAQKLGLPVPAGWAAYALGEQLFIKHFDYHPRAVYPDHGVNFETFTNADMLELESLGPLSVVAPGGAVQHRETWRMGEIAAGLERENLQAAAWQAARPAWAG